MDTDGLAAFKAAVKGASSYLEYGCGGSTILAANSGVKNIIAVDTSSEWAGAVRDAVAQVDGVRATIAHCDVGEVGDWGVPLSNARINDYHKYAVMPWYAAKKMGVVPGLVLVDGRFRVACFLYTLISARVGTAILFDDYGDRPGYHVVEQFCDLEEMHGRMGAFIVRKHYSFPDIAETFAKYSIVVG
jgi:hypothetical protein